MLSHSQLLFHPGMAPRGFPPAQQHQFGHKMNPMIFPPPMALPHNMAPHFKQLPQVKHLVQQPSHVKPHLFEEAIGFGVQPLKEANNGYFQMNNQIYLDGTYLKRENESSSKKKEKKAVNKFEKLFQSTILNAEEKNSTKIDKVFHSEKKVALTTGEESSLFSSQILGKFNQDEELNVKTNENVENNDTVTELEKSTEDPKWKDLLRQNETLSAFDEKIKEIIERTRENHNRILRLKNSSSTKTSEPGSLDSNKGKYLEGSTTASIEEDASKTSEKENIVNFATFDDHNVMFNSCDGTFFVNEAQNVSPKFLNSSQKFKKTSKTEKKTKIDELLERIDVLKNRYIFEDLKISPKNPLTAMTVSTINSSSSPQKKVELTNSIMTVSMDANTYRGLVAKKKQDLSEYELETKDWKITDFQLGRCLGKGRFGAVHLAKDKNSNFTVAIKIIERNQEEGERLVEQIKNECKLQSFLDHPNIIKMYGWFSDVKNMYLILEYAPGGDLYNLMNMQPGRRFDERTVATFIKQVAESIKYLHQNSVIHRDIKPENIMISNGVLKLSDFGWAIYAPKERRRTFCGTLDYVSPEVVEGHSYDEKIDIWSIGVLCYELSVGKAPFEQPSEHETFQQIVTVRYQIPYFFSYELRDFLNAILIREPKYRLDIDGILNHPWIVYNTRGQSNCGEMRV